MGGGQKETVGLLFVHGIGQQKRFDHLTGSVSEIAELLRRDGHTTCAVIDRTAGWQGAVGEPTATGVAPVTLQVERGGRQTTFECHEVYWADLGARDGIVDTIRFWLWGLGQWAAPVYRDLDAAQLTKGIKDAAGHNLNRQASQLARLPRSVAGNFHKEISARIQLALAGLAALLTLASWTLVKRIGGALFQSAPSPSLLVQYIGDVRTYEEGARPGDTALSDPGYPRRVGIRRRMVSQMVAMGDRAAKHDYDRWYVLGHSLGSVVAYNGLTEIGHTLPNYLGQDQWRRLHRSLKRDPGCRLRDEAEVPLMMPARPPWLAHEDVINRPELFARLSGILTYGSPLNKFAGLWPRIVATATDRKDPNTGHATIKNVFPKACRWINLHAPQDPVAGNLDSFGARAMGPSLIPDAKGKFRTLDSKPQPTQFDGFIPKPETYTTPFWQPYLLAHLNYFQNKAAYASGYAIKHREELARWLINPRQTISAIEPLGPIRIAGKHGIAIAVIGVVLALATTMVTLAGGIGWNLFTGKGAEVWDWHETPQRIACNLVPVLLLASGVVLGAGLLRWAVDSYRNLREAAARLDQVRGTFPLSGAVRLAQQDRMVSGVAPLQAQPAAADQAPPDPFIVRGNEALRRLHARQLAAAVSLIVLSLAVVVGMVYCPAARSARHIGMAEVGLGLFAILAQVIANLTISPLRRAGQVPCWRQCLRAWLAGG
ncbi:MAG: hypothetical protein K2X68_13755 [Novosphingobium sp.]|nr:hypothetical protein [Novosphingobium sp.]